MTLGEKKDTIIHKGPQSSHHKRNDWTETPQEKAGPSQ